MVVRTGNQIGFRPCNLSLDPEAGVTEDAGVDVLFAGGLAVGDVEIDASGGGRRLVGERARRSGT